LMGTFIVLHGLVHLWFVVLSQRLIAFEAEMGWSGESWLLSNFMPEPATRMLATVLYTLATLGFVAGGVGLFLQQEWWSPVVIGAALFSAVTIFLFWDGGMQMIVEKGLLGLLINIAILIALLVFKVGP